MINTGENNCLSSFTWMQSYRIGLQSQYESVNVFLLSKKIYGMIPMEEIAENSKYVLKKKAI